MSVVKDLGTVATKRTAEAHEANKRETEGDPQDCLEILVPSIVTET